MANPRGGTLWGAAVCRLLGCWMLTCGMGMAGVPAISGWVVYWDADDSLRVLQAYTAQLHEVSVFAYHFDERGQVVPASPAVVNVVETLMAQPPQARPRVLVSIVNDVVTAAGSTRLKDAQRVHDAVTLPQARGAHVKGLLAVAAKADGLEIDYENLRAEDRHAFSSFIRQLADGLHARGQWLSVVVQPKTGDRLRDGAGAVDWAAIGEAADQVKVMAYHYHHAGGTPGPLAPPAWVEQLTRFARTQIPQEKLCLVLTLHGFDWPRGQAARSVDYPSAMRLAAAAGVAPQRDDEGGALTFRYETDGIPHEVWVEDAVSVQQKIARLRALHVPAIGLWHLGAGAAVVGETLQAVTSGAPPSNRQTPRP